MRNLAKGIKETLPDFQKFLLERSPAPEKNVPFPAYWVSRFLNFVRKRNLTVTKSPLDALYGAEIIIETKSQVHSHCGLSAIPF